MENTIPITIDDNLFLSVYLCGVKFLFKCVKG